MKLSLLFVVILSVSLSALGQSFNNEAWLEDFAQLKQEMSAHYANLEWSVNERGLNLKQLSDETETKLREAKNDNEAKIFNDNFLRNFGDGHLLVDWAANNTTAAPQQTTPSLCARLGYQSRPLRPGVDFTTLKNYQPLNNNETKFIRAGSGTLTNGKKFGVVRIGLFSEEVFPELCETALTELKLPADSNCDQNCENSIRSKTANLYTAALTAV